MPSPHTVLVVDDEPSMLRYMQTLLELENYKVELAETADQGFAFLANRTYDLVLLDISLPDAQSVPECEAWPSSYDASGLAVDGGAWIASSM